MPYRDPGSHLLPYAGVTLAICLHCCIYYTYTKMGVLERLYNEFSIWTEDIPTSLSVSVSVSLSLSLSLLLSLPLLQTMSEGTIKLLK